MKQHIRTVWLLTMLAAFASAAARQIKAMDLRAMVQASDHAIHGRILSKKVSRVFAEDGREVFFTTLKLAGRSLEDASSITVDVSYPGGFLNPLQGYWHSESPGEDETKVGAHVVVFYKWMDGMGGAHATNWIYAHHGGIYQALQGPKGTVVLGRGRGYPVSKNLAITDLEASIRRLGVEDAKRKRDGAF